MHPKDFSVSASFFVRLKHQVVERDTEWKANLSVNIHTGEGKAH